MVQSRSRQQAGTGAVGELLGNFERRHALVVLGPDPFGAAESRKVVLLHPGELSQASNAMAASCDFGSAWREARGSMVSWETLDRQRATSEWRELWYARGFRSFVRVEIPLPAGRAFECFLFTEEELRHESGESAKLAWWLMGSWHELREVMQSNQTPQLNERERACLALAFQGFTAGETALRLNIPERRVNLTYQQAMEKLQVPNKVAAIQRACWLGMI